MFEMFPLLFNNLMGNNQGTTLRTDRFNENKIISKIAKELCINHSTILREIDRSANITLVAKYLVHTKIDEIKHLFSYLSK